MVTIVFEAEVKITEAQYKVFKKQGHKMVMPDQSVAQVFGKDIKFTKAYVQFKEKGQL